MLLKYFLFFLFAFCLASINAQNEQKVKAYILNVAKKCCTNAYEILDNDSAESIAFFLKNNTENISVSDFGTVVHESLHQLDFTLSFDIKKFDNKEDYGSFPYAYFIDRDIKIYVPRKNVFKVDELHSNYFPEEVKKLFRYSTYIYNDNSNNVFTKHKAYGAIFGESFSKLSSNQDGIYGLLEEFNAYYHGVNAEFELLKSNQTEIKFTGASNIICSYYEFNIFMAYYIKYAKEKNREVYDLLMNLKELRVAYTLMEKNWRTLLTNIYTSEHANKYPVESNEDVLFTNELKTIMNKFMIPDDQLTSYLSFLKKQKYDSDAIVKNKVDETNKFQFESDFNDIGDFFVDDYESKLTINGKDIELKKISSSKYYLILLKTIDLNELLSKFIEVMDDSKIEIYKHKNEILIVVDVFNEKSQAIKKIELLKNKYPNVQLYEHK
jgi:hypothetical protein